MALIFPYSLAFFSDTARILRTDLDLRRFDETSGGGDGAVLVGTDGDTALGG